MNNFTADDQQGRMKFKEEFKNYYRMADTPGEYNHFDIYLTACTNSSCYNTEIKKRSYSINDLSGGTIIEKIKVDAFREAFRQDRERCYTYFNYYFEDSWISFDIKNRLKYDIGFEKVYIIDLPATTSDCGEDRKKEVYFLAFTNNMYVQDKMKVRCNNY